MRNEKRAVSHWKAEFFLFFPKATTFPAMGDYVLEFFGGPWDGGAARCESAPPVVYVGNPKKKPLGSLGEYFSDASVDQVDPEMEKIRYVMNLRHRCSDPMHKVYHYHPYRKPSEPGLTESGV